MALVGYTDDLDWLDVQGEPYSPLKDSYTVTLPDEVDQLGTDISLNLAEIKYHNNPFLVSATYKFVTPMEMSVFEVFVFFNIRKRFVASFEIVPGVFEPFVCQILGDVTFKKNGYGGSVTLQLEVDGGGE